MYLQSVDDISTQNVRYLSQKFKKFRDFFKIVHNVDRDDLELSTIKEELHIYRLMNKTSKKDHIKKATIK